MNPPADLVERVERLLGSRVASGCETRGGYSIAEHWSLTLDDGNKVFAKLATTDDIAQRIRDEHRNMASLDADFVCRIIAFEDDDRPLLVLEDLSHGRWPPPWEPGDVERVLDALDELADTEPPEHVPHGAAYWAINGWQQIGQDPALFLSLEICSREWLDHCLPALVDAERLLVLSGGDLVHGDMWSSNICLPDDGVVFVDWNFASRGDRRCDIALWLPSLRLEGGPLPEEVRPDLATYAAALSGFFGARAGLPAPEGAPTVRRFQLRQLRIALPWACRELGLPQPDVPYARIEIERIDHDLDTGGISEAEWHERIEEVLIDAYLASDDPRAQSGKGGDESDWRWARELVLDVFPRSVTFLDIGCANGYLMESVHRWGAERGIDVEPYGLDISWRIASLARHRLPGWADRIFVGNAIDWEPPRRFDVVQAGLDEVPPSRWRELTERILREFLVPGGRLVLRAPRVGPGTEEVGDQLRAAGFEPEGVIEARHPRSGELRRTVWVSAPVA